MMQIMDRTAEKPNVYAKESVVAQMSLFHSLKMRVVATSTANPMRAAVRCFAEFCMVFFFAVLPSVSK